MLTGDQYMTKIHKGIITSPTKRSATDNEAKNRLEIGRRDKFLIKTTIILLRFLSQLLTQKRKTTMIDRGTLRC